MESSPLTITASFSTSTPLLRLCSLSSDVGELAQRAARIRTAAERCGCIVKRFVAMSCQRGPEKKPVDLNQIVRAVLENARDCRLASAAGASARKHKGLLWVKGGGRAAVRRSALPQKADQPLLQSIISSVPIPNLHYQPD